MCVHIFSVIIIPMKSRFLNPVAQADTLNKIILIPHGRRNENEEINMVGGALLPLSTSLYHPWTPVASSTETVLFPIVVWVREGDIDSLCPWQRTAGLLTCNNLGRGSGGHIYTVHICMCSTMGIQYLDTGKIQARSFFSLSFYLSAISPKREWMGFGSFNINTETFIHCICFLYCAVAIESQMGNIYWQ